MFYHITRKSGNVKVGPIPVSTSSNQTCPPSCPFIDAGCYAKLGPLKLHWDKVSDGRRGMTFPQFLEEVRDLPKGQIWRFAQAGDLPGVGNTINAEDLRALAVANANRPVLAYTHKPLTPENEQALRDATQNGFHVNISAESFEKCDELIDKGLSTVVVLPSEYQKANTESLKDYKDRLLRLKSYTPKGRKVAICPATYTDTNCLNCKACSKPRPQGTVIGFPAHGAQKKRVDSYVGDTS